MRLGYPNLELLYIVFDAKAEFFEDLKDRNLESVGSAMRRY